MQIKQFVVGDVATNCYLVWDEKSHEGAIVDPGDCAEQLIQTIQEDHVQLKYILLTHAHFDHILAVGAIQRATGAQVVVSKKDEYLLDANAALSPLRMADSLCAALTSRAQIFGRKKAPA